MLHVGVLQARLDREEDEAEEDEEDEEEEEQKAVESSELRGRQLS